MNERQSNLNLGTGKSYRRTSFQKPGNGEELLNLSIPHTKFGSTARLLSFQLPLLLSICFPFNADNQEFTQWEFAGSLAPAPTPHLAKGWDQAGEEGRLYLNETWKPSHYSGWGIFIP